MREFFFAMLLAASLAHAQKGGGDDGAIPYPEDESEDDRNRRELPKKSDASPNLHEETDVESQDREQSMAHLDDPSIGLSLEAILGLVLQQSSVQGVEPHFMAGVRFTWEWSRTLSSDEYLREYFFADVNWSYTSAPHVGTSEIFSDSNFHYVTLAPAFSLPIFHKSPIAAFAQVGVGFATNLNAITINGISQGISGTKLLLQYGLGLRGRPMIVEFNGGSLRISFRIEATRFRRGYLDDTFLGGSVGVTF